MCFWTRVRLPSGPVLKRLVVEHGSKSLLARGSRCPGDIGFERTGAERRPTPVWSSFKKTRGRTRVQKPFGTDRSKSFLAFLRDINYNKVT